MALPQIITVKFSSEAAGFVSISPVELRRLSTQELVEQVLASTGKDEVRVREVLLRGSLVNDAARLRWAGFEATPDEVSKVLQRFPDPQPDLPFDVARCEKAILLGRRGAVSIEKQVASERGWFRKRSFWEALVDQAQAGGLEYSRYSYADRADVYRKELSPSIAAGIEESSGLLRYSTLTKQIQLLQLTAIEWLNPR